MFTYGGSSGTAFELNQAINRSQADAVIVGCELVLRTYLAVSAITRSQGAPKTAFISETKFTVENMMKSFSKRLEIQLMYGQSGIGVVESITGNVLKIYKHEWAPGIWSGAENALLTILDPTLATDRNVAGYKVSAVNLETKEITVTNATGVVADDIIFFFGAAAAGGTFFEFAGVHKILTNTGILFGINAGTYGLWRSNVVDVGSNFSGGEAVLSLGKIEKGIELAMNKGLADEMVTVICNQGSWTNLLNEQTPKRMFDKSYDPKELDNGAMTLKFYGPNGAIEIVASIYCKEGYSYILPLANFARIGSSDTSFEEPGFEGKFIRQLENHHGFEIRAFCDQALFTHAPGLCTLLRYIKN